MSPEASAIVIGAGISGLTAAYQRQKGGYEVTVLEARPAAGGRCISAGATLQVLTPEVGYILELNVWRGSGSSKGY
jgi:monoamine oxidase